MVIDCDWNSEHFKWNNLESGSIVSILNVGSSCFSFYFFQMNCIPNNTVLQHTIPNYIIMFYLLVSSSICSIKNGANGYIKTSGDGTYQLFAEASLQTPQTDPIKT